MIVNRDKFNLGSNNSITILDSGFEYLRNVNIVLKVAEWDIGAAGRWDLLPPGLIKKVKSLLNIQNKGNMCFAYCIAAYLLRREAAARRAREAPPAVPADIAFCAAVTQQANYEAEVAQNRGAPSYINSPPIWPPPVLSLAPATVEERKAEPGYTDEIDPATVYENDGVVYPESDARNPFDTHIGNLYKPG